MKVLYVLSGLLALSACQELPREKAAVLPKSTKLVQASGVLLHTCMPEDREENASLQFENTNSTSVSIRVVRSKFGEVTQAIFVVRPKQKYHLLVNGVQTGMYAFYVYGPQGAPIGFARMGCAQPSRE